MTVWWTENAENHLARIHAYIAQNSVEYAQAVVDRLTKRSQQIADYPLSGRCVPEYNLGQIREIIEGSYRIIYHISASRIDILAVLHGAMNTLSEKNEADSE